MGRQHSISRHKPHLQKSQLCQRKSRGVPLQKLLKPNHYLLSFWMIICRLKEVDGGLKPANKTQGRVGQLVYRVDDTVGNASLLWNNDAMVHLRRTFIEGNHLLSKPKKVGTIRAYLTSFLMFHNFMLPRRQAWQTSLVCKKKTFI